MFSNFSIPSAGSPHFGLVLYCAKHKKRKNLYTVYLFSDNMNHTSGNLFAKILLSFFKLKLKSDEEIVHLPQIAP